MKAPAHLTESTTQWFEEVCEQFELESHHLKLLQLAAEALDRVTEARAIIDKAGIVIEDRFGAPRTHPAVAIERDSRIAYARLLRELDLDTEAPREASRPPQLHSVRR